MSPNRFYAALAAALFLALPVTAQSLPETDCDRLAGYDHAPRLPGLAGAYAIRDAAAAVSACEDAVAADPDDPYLGILLSRALIAVDPDDARALDYVQRAAAALPSLADSRLGLLYLNGQAGLAEDRSRALVLFAAACARRDDPHGVIGCNNLGNELLAPGADAADAARGFALLEQACDGGLAMGCLSLGYALENGADADANRPRIIALYRGACNAGDLMACNNLGYIQETGNGMDIDLSAALENYQCACDGGEMLGCENLGEAYRLGTGVEADPARAEAFFQAACDRDEVYACFALGTMLADGEGLSVDVPRAVALLAQACDLGDTEACERAESLR